MPAYGVQEKARLLIQIKARRPAMGHPGGLEGGMERQIIRIDEEKCDGCGQCAQGCPEGALQMIDGKARLVSEITCDGLGACIGECPRGAIAVETREAEPYDERRTLDQLLPKGANTLKAHLKHLADHAQTAYLDQALGYLKELGVAVPAPGHRGCPGSAPRTLAPQTPAPGPGQASQASQLGQWPVQLHLISPQNPVFQQADLLLAADCTAFAMADFNRTCLPGKRLAIACPKLDGNQEAYLAKLTALIQEAQVKSVTVMIMEVPCCGGLLRLVQAAAERAARKVPIRLVVVGIDGQVRRDGWVA
ncbi:MAG: 4Fe-4S binding protein [Holophaga sp.]|nr:4Fe-4S binding protein [Holophaga sp.]